MKKKPVTDFVSNSEETHHKVNTNETKQFLNNFPFKFPEVMRLWRCGNQLCWYARETTHEAKVEGGNQQPEVEHREERERERELC